MSMPIKLHDKKGENIAGVTKLGQVVVAPIEYSIPKYSALTVINTAYNFFPPKTRKEIVITDIIISTNKDVTVNGSLIEIYCANNATSLTVEEEILTTQSAKNTTTVLTGLNWKIPSGFWINAKCASATVYITITGYYIQK